MPQVSRLLAYRRSGRGDLRLASFAPRRRQDIDRDLIPFAIIAMGKTGFSANSTTSPTCRCRLRRRGRGLNGGDESRGSLSRVGDRLRRRRLSACSGPLNVARTGCEPSTWAQRSAVRTVESYLQYWDAGSDAGRKPGAAWLSLRGDQGRRARSFEESRAAYVCGGLGGFCRCQCARDAPSRRK